MCEPFHSISQFPDTDPDSGNPLQPVLDLSFKGLVMDWSRKIGKWLHYSRLGAGHSESIRYAVRHHGKIPEAISYETAWWERKVRIDGSFNYTSQMMHKLGIRDPRVIEVWKEDALESATIYGERTVSGNLSLFRRFFEGSIAATERPILYIEQFLSRMVSAQGAIEFEKKIKLIERHVPKDRTNRWTLRRGIYATLERAVRHNVTACVKVAMGLTRKRNMLCDEWAGDDKLWI